MASLKSLLERIDSAPDGPQVTAIFDFDGTLIAGFSATVFIREQLRRGDLSPRDFAAVAAAMANFGLGNIGFSALMVVTAQFMRGIEEEDYQALGQELYQDFIARLIYPESRALVEAHQRKGHTVAVISSATPYQVEPAANDMGIEHVLCTKLEVENGKFTGSVVHPTCFGEGKVNAALELNEKVGAQLEDSFFYTDSTDDLQLLARVGKPCALNPSSKLLRFARKQKWPSAHFGSRGRPTVMQFLRSITATGSLVTSFLAGLPIYALTGSRRDANNFSFSLFADTASALIGLRLKVKGEENLWRQRPAVFVFNHQSKADVIIMASLLRRDVAGVGKKEIRDMPIIGRVMEAGGVVMIDRKNTANAIEAMQPLVDAMQKDGKSVVLAPEGTRTITPRLNPFKKGAFHLAMQAGVPIVPVVIRNAGDVAPKGDFVFRPATVDVTVLEPIDTSSWSPKTIDKHVADVRELYLDTLGQDDATIELAPVEKVPVKRPRKVPARAKVKPETKAKTKAKAKAPKKSASTKTAEKRKSTPVKKTPVKKAPAKKAVAVKASPTSKRKVTAKKASTSRAKATARPKAMPKNSSQ